MFVKTIFEFVGEKKLTALLMKIHKHTLAFDVNKLKSLDFQNMELTQIGLPTVTMNKEYIISEIKDCNAHELYYLLDKYIFDEINNDKLNQEKS